VNGATQWSERVKELLLDAIERPAAERAAFLDEAAGDDPDLRARLDELIRAWDHATGLPRDPAEHNVASAMRSFIEDGRDLTGERVGPFIIEDSIGEGGFGLVYRARQEEPVRREVALKILKPGLDRTSVLTRFEIERQALALLTHPSIARVYDFGSTPDGRPYFAMELIDGLPITEYCFRHGLSIPQRLLLFRRVCLAVQHAHQKGIIHRDLKPSNLLVTEVDGVAQPRIIDFGIAKALDEPLTDVTQVTAARQLLGTPRYMSPEQAMLDTAAVDTRSDTYSLGIVLYELLCGSTPLTDDELRQMNLASLGSALREMRFPKPSTRAKSVAAEVSRAEASRSDARGEHRGAASDHDVDRLVRLLSGDLDWITMKAIDPDPARRYQTAYALARDIERHLDREPVEARPPRRAYLARKFVSRHRVGVAGAVGVFLALVVGLTAALIGFRQASVERDAANAALEEAKYVTDFLSTAISAVDPAELGRDVRVADVLDEASRELNETFDGRATTEARIRFTLSNAYRSLGEWPSAEREIRRAVHLWREGAGEDDPRTIRATLNLASLRLEQGFIEEALEINTEALERLRNQGGANDALLIGGLNNHALILRDLGRGDEVREIQEEVLERQRAANGPDHALTLGAMRNLAITLLHMGRTEEAEALLVEAKDRAIAAHGEDSIETADAEFSLGDFYLGTGRPDLAVEHIAAALALRREIHGDRHPATLHALFNQARALSMSGRGGEAVPLLREIVDEVPAVLSPRHPVATAAISELAGACVMTQWRVLPPDEAQHLVDLMIAASSNPRLPYNAANNFAMSLLELEEQDAATIDAALTLARLANAQTSDVADRWNYMDTLSLALSAAGEHDEAIRVQEAALKIVPADESAARAEMESHLDEIRARAEAASATPQP
jgi:serine/threonine protein kinase/tetratricopeptide (TPR) repeat protein